MRHYIKIQSSASCNDSSFKPIEIMNIFTAFLLLIIGAVSACLVVIFESQYKRFIKQNPEFENSQIVKINVKDVRLRKSENVIKTKKEIYSDLGKYPVGEI